MEMTETFNIQITHHLQNWDDFFNFEKDDLDTVIVELKSRYAMTINIWNSYTPMRIIGNAN